MGQRHDERRSACGTWTDLMEGIENKVANSGLVTINLEELKPNWKLAGFDMANVLYQGLVLREKDFREFVKTNDWTAFQGKSVFVYCSVDAIVPTWAYMLIATALSGIFESSVFGSKQMLETQLWRKVIQAIDLEIYRDKRIVIKGCSDEAINETIYMELTSLLIPVAKSLMYGEPCSTVPLFKRK